MSNSFEETGPAKEQIEINVYSAKQKPTTCRCCRFAADMRERSTMRIKAPAKRRQGMLDGYGSDAPSLTNLGYAESLSGSTVAPRLKSSK